MGSGPDQRLEAMIVAGEWGHHSVLDLLRRGLRDSDSRVVEAAASASRIAVVRRAPRLLRPRDRHATWPGCGKSADPDSRDRCG